MTKIKKISIVIILCALLMLALLIIGYQNEVNIRILFNQIIDIYFTNIIFLIITMFFLILLGGLLFFPIEKKVWSCAFEDGELRLENRSIENFILNVVKDGTLIFEPKVKISIKRKLIKIKVTGKTRNEKNICIESEKLSLIIKDRMTLLLGDSLAEIFVIVKISDFKMESSSKKINTVSKLG